MSKNLYILIISGMLSILSTSGAFAQRLAVKSNLLADALASPNIEAELLVSTRWTLDFAAHYQPFAPRDNRRWKHWILQPEARRWLCTPFAGHFLGVHALGGRFNVGGVHLPFHILKGAREARYEGWFLGAGISYGYHWVLSPHWGMEAALGVGAAFLRSDRYRCGHCGSKQRDVKNKGYYGPTKAAVSIVYMIK
uniref:DUF3575 domain-containing protein n=1 Tax=Bacteroides clarus TaxID=626929 RepID=UPI003FED6D16